MISSTAVWKYYRKIPPDQAVCIVCSKNIKTGGGTTNVRNHLKSKHREYFLSEIEGNGATLAFQPKSEITEVIVDADEIIQEVLQVEPAINACNNISRSFPRPITAVRDRSRSRERYRRREPEVVPSRSETLRQEVSLTDALTFMIYKDNRSVEILEEEGFQRFMKTVAPYCAIPSKDTITEMITAQYEKSKADAVEKLREVEYLSLSIYTCAVRTRTFLAVATHFISRRSQKPETIFLGIRPLSSTVEIELLSSEIHNILDLFDLEYSKVISVCTDGTSNMTSVVESLFGEGKHIQCLTLVLNSVLKDGLEDISNPTLRQLIDDVEAIVTNVDFIETQDEELAEVLSKKCYTATDRFVFVLPRVAQVLAASTFENFSFDNQLIAEINKILALFEAASQEISSDEQLTGGIILPVISCVKSALQNMSLVNEVAKILRRKLLASVIAQTKNHLTNPLLCVATLCDPRFQKIYLSPFVANQSVSSCVNEVKLHLRELRRSSRSSYCERTTRSKENPLWWKHDKNIAEGGFNSHVEADTSIVSEDEMKMYLGQELLPRNADPVKFWLQSKGCMPSLSHVALRNLTVIGCRVPEELFVPNLDSLLRFKKYRLSDDQLVQRIFLRCNKVDDFV